MIDTMAQLLERILAKETAALDRMQLSHGPTIGAMFEGLTRSVLDLALPREADIRVVSGFAADHTGAQSRQLDCMVVMGDGRKIPHTESYIYPIEKVLAVIEVKKTLHGAEVSEGQENLHSLRSLDIMESPTVGNSIRAAFQLVTGHPAPDRIVDLPPSLRGIYRLIARDAIWPATILLGYHGYRTESAVRERVANYLENAPTGPPRGPGSVPTLVLNDSVAVAKLTGFPWSGAIRDGWWPFLGTSSGRSVPRLFLDVLWTRLNHRRVFDRSAFGDDKTLNAWNVLCEGRWETDPEGWTLRLQRPQVTPIVPARDDKEWSPVQVTTRQADLLLHLGKVGYIDMTEVEYADATRDDLLSDLLLLQSFRIVGPRAGSEHIWEYLTIECACVFLPDGTAWAGDDSSGRLTRWIAEQLGRV